MKLSTKLEIGFGAMLGIIFVIQIIRWLKKKWLDYQNNKDRTYNVFDKAELSALEIQEMKKWGFVIPDRLKQTLNHEVKMQGNDHEIILTFS